MKNKKSIRVIFPYQPLLLFIGIAVLGLSFPLKADAGCHIGANGELICIEFESHPCIYAGLSCTSLPNMCGQTASGEYNCFGDCLAATPPDSNCSVNSCTKTGGNVSGIIYGQDDGVFYLEPKGAALGLEDSFFCRDFGVTIGDIPINNNNNLQGKAFSPDFGDIDFSNAILVLGDYAAALHGSLSLSNPGYTLALPPIPTTSSDYNNCDNVIINKGNFQMLKDNLVPLGVCLNYADGHFAGWIVHPVLGYMKFDAMHTTWRPAIQPASVTLTADKTSVPYGQSVNLSWTMSGEFTHCSASSTDGSLTETTVVEPPEGSATVTPLRMPSVTYTISCITKYSAEEVKDRETVIVSLPSSCSLSGFSSGKLNAWVQNCGSTFAQYLTSYGVYPETDSPLIQHVQNGNINGIVSFFSLPQQSTQKGPLLKTEGNILYELKQKFREYICSLEELGVNGSDPISNMHLDALGITDPSCSIPVTVPTVDITLYPQDDPSVMFVAGEVTDDGGSPLTSLGVTYATGADSLPTDTNVITIPMNSSELQRGRIEALISGLLPDTTYSFWTYATNGVGTGYSSRQLYSYPANTNSNSLPVVIIPDRTITIGSTTANLFGQILSPQLFEDGTGYSYGIEYFDFTNGQPYEKHQVPRFATEVGTWIYHSLLSGLTPGHTYYYRAYATNSAGTAYSENKGEPVSGQEGLWVRFTTASGITPGSGG